MVELPRDMIDSHQTDGSDKKYSVLAFDLQSNKSIDATFAETGATFEYCALAINFTKGTDLVKITGTHILPEFSGSLAMVLLTSALSIMLVSGKKILGKSKIFG